MATNKPRVLIWDIESSHNLVLSFDLWADDGIPHRNVIQERHLFCIGYKWLGEKKIHSISILDDPKRFKKDHHDDFYVVNEFRKVLASADAQIYHHGDKFDLPMLNARLAFHGLDPLPKIPSIDTKKVAKKYFRFNSNRLDYLARFLGYKGKMENPSGLWLDAFAGDEKALKHMEKYCRQDIDINEYVYDALAPFIQGSKTNQVKGEVQCPRVGCGSFNLRRGGVNKTKAEIGTREYQRYQCNDCGTWCDERTAIKQA